MSHTSEPMLPPLLFRRRVQVGDGPKAFLRLVSEENALTDGFLRQRGVTFCEEHLARLGLLCAEPEDERALAYVRRVSKILLERGETWITTASRLCPRCLQEGRQWQVGWEIRFADACPEHAVWLVDRCQCGRLLSWRRHELWKCACGETVLRFPTAACATPIAELSRALRAPLLGEEVEFGAAVLQGLSLSERQRVIEVLGLYSDPGRSHQRGRSTSDRMEFSWNVTSTAAEVLAGWPRSFHEILAHHQRYAEGTVAAGRLSSTFGGLFRRLYQGAPPCFAALRTVFEDHVTLNWTGALGKRNSRLAPKTVLGSSWVPVTHAAAKLKITPSTARKRLREIGGATATRVTEKGRVFTVASRHAIQSLNEGGGSRSLTLCEAAEKLGLAKRRVLALARAKLLPAQKRSGFASSWSLAAHDLEPFLLLVSGAPLVDDCPTGAVALGHVVRYSAGGESLVCGLISALLGRELSAIARLASVQGLSGLLLSSESVQRLKASFLAKDLSGRMTMPEAAIQLGVKQEVAYHLSRSGLLAAKTERFGSSRRRGFTTWDALEQFRERHVFARDLARETMCSPKFVVARLRELGVVPIAGPDVDGCRQVIYRRDLSLKCALPEVRASSPQSEPISTAAL